MRRFRSTLLLLSAIALVTALASAQYDDSQPSLGDVARQARLKRQKDEQAADTPSKDAQTNGAPAQASQTKDPLSKATPSKDAPTKDAQPAATSASGKDSQKDAASKTAAAKDASANDTLAKGPKKVITNDEIPEHVGPTSTLPQRVKVPGAPDPAPNYADGKVPADYFKGQIQSLKEAISTLESEIQDVTDSIRYAGANCVTNCVLYNEQQQQKEQQVKMMTSQLSQEQQTLESLQEMARKQGYSSAVYDP
jgi:hypothetical protein